MPPEGNKSSTKKTDSLEKTLCEGNITYSSEEIYGLNDFLGNEETKNEMKEIYLQLSGGKVFKSMGVKPDRSFIFYGENGTGKTFGVNCIGGELANEGKRILIARYEIGQYGTAYINKGSVILQSFFDEHRSLLKNKENGINKILYIFDEAEVLMGKRGSNKNGHKEDDKLLNTLMLNLQQISNSDEEQYIFFMTNKIDLIDDASIRSGRVDRKVKFQNPDYPARYELFSSAIKKINDKAKYHVIRNFDLDELAKKSDNFNCVDCLEIPSRAVKNKVNEILIERTNKNIPKAYIHQRILIDEIEKQRLTYSRTKKAKIGFQL